jgi:hypothetical protein
MSKNLTATFKAYIGADRDSLLGKLIGIAGWSHIESQPTASAEINHVEIKAYFTQNGVRVKNAIRGATVLGGWRLQSFQ